MGLEVQKESHPFSLRVATGTKITESAAAGGGGGGPALLNPTFGNLSRTSWSFSNLSLILHSLSISASACNALHLFFKVNFLFFLTLSLRSFRLTSSPKSIEAWYTKMKCTSKLYIYISNQTMTFQFSYVQI